MSSFYTNSEDLITMKNQLEDLNEHLITHYNSVLDFLELLVTLGWKDDLNGRFSAVAKTLNEEFPPISRAMVAYAAIKGQEAALEMRIRELNVPKLNI